MIVSPRSDVDLLTLNRKSQLGVEALPMRSTQRCDARVRGPGAVPALRDLESLALKLWAPGGQCTFHTALDVGRVHARGHHDADPAPASYHGLARLKTPPHLRPGLVRHACFYSAICLLFLLAVSGSGVWRIYLAPRSDAPLAQHRKSLLLQIGHHPTKVLAGSQNPHI